MLTLDEVVTATRGRLVGGSARSDGRLGSVVVDSRQVTPGALFVALKGEHHDAHVFVRQALADGAASAIVERVPDGCEAAPLVVVPSSPDALADMARFALARHRRQVGGLEVVGITGSIGKTTTKEVVASVLGDRAPGRVLKTQGNLNSEIGLPMTLLNGLEAQHEIAVLEMAMYQAGDIRFLARLAHPRVGVVTAVQPVHLGRMGTIDAIQQAKQELVEELPTDGVAVLNGDDPLVAKMERATAARVVRYGVSGPAEVRAEHIASRGLDGVTFDLLHASSGQSQQVHLPLLGTHNVYAALAAAAVGLEEGLSLADIGGALGNLSSTLRLVVVDGINGSRLIDDSYNASPASVIAALNVLSELPGSRKVAVLGDMLELGSEEEPGHRRVGQRAADVADVLITYGERSHTLAEVARTAGGKLRADAVIEGDSHEAIVERLKSELRPGDDVLVKGSLAMGMSAVVRGIRAGGEGA